MKEKASNKKVEKEAIDTVKKYLESKGKNADSLGEKGDLCYDNIHVEVKGTRRKWKCVPGESIWPYITLGSEKLTEFFEENPERFEFWAVDNLEEGTEERTIVRIKGTELKKFIDKNPEKKEYHLQIKLGKAFWHGRKTKFLKLEK